jgi:hypothetical protein
MAVTNITKLLFKVLKFHFPYIGILSHALRHGQSHLWNRPPFLVATRESLVQPFLPYLYL